jgi:hypothetical protein
MLSPSSSCLKRKKFIAKNVVIFLDLCHIPVKQDNNLPPNQMTYHSPIQAPTQKMIFSYKTVEIPLLLTICS